MPSIPESYVQNEASRLIRGKVEPSRTGGAINTSESHEQVLDIAASTFLMDNRAVFHLVKLSINHLLTKVNKEVDLAEDMLVALEGIGRQAIKVTDTSSISNAQTALLALDTATSVKGRSELDRFAKNVDKFAENFRTIVSEGVLVMPKEESREVLRKNFIVMESTHSGILEALSYLSGFVANYEAQDIPTRVSRKAFTNIREGFDEILELTENPTELDLRARSALIRSLTAKSTAAVIADVSERSKILFRGPGQPVPSGAAYRGRAAGTGTAPSALTASGPWVLPLEKITFKADGGASQDIDLDEIIGASLQGRNDGNFTFTTDNDSFFVMVDPKTYTGSVVATGSSNTVLVADGFGTDHHLGFKHLGATLQISSPLYSPDDVTVTVDDQYPRAITDFGLLVTYSGITSWNPTTREITFASLTRALVDDDVGRYFKDSSGNRAEIAEVLSSDTAVLTEDVTLSGTGTLRGGDGDQVTVEFIPAMVNSIANSGWDNKLVSILPSIKGGNIPAGTFSASTVASALNANAKNTTNPGSKLGDHVVVSVDSTGNRVVVSALSRRDPLIQIISYFPYVNGTSAEEATVREDSVHAVLGLIDGEIDTGLLLQPSELATYINDRNFGITASVEEEDVLESTATTVAQDVKITDTSQDFVTLGAQAGYQVEITEGLYPGIYCVTAVAATQLTLDVDENFGGNSEVSYRLFTQQTRITLDTSVLGSSLEIVSAPTELELTADIQYGTLNEFEAADKRGNLLEFDGARTGDYLVTVRGDMEITSVDGTRLTVDGLFSTLSEALQFEVQRQGDRFYNAMTADLATYTTSTNLLKKWKLDESLYELDAALSPLLSAGSPLPGAKGRVQRILTHLVSILTSAPSRTGEYTVSIPEASLNLSELLQGYSVDGSEDVEDFISGLQERKKDRAVDLLLKGDIGGFFETTADSASYGTNVMNSVRDAVADLPEYPSRSSGVFRESNIPSEITSYDDPEEVFEEDDEWADELDWSS